MRSALGHRAVEGVGRRAEMVRLAADLVERDEAVVAIEHRVLERLGHDGAGRLLEALREGQRRGPILGGVKVEQNEAREKIEGRLVLDLARGLCADECVGDDGPVDFAGAVLIDVGAIDR